jgi:DNA polymerase-4
MYGRTITLKVKFEDFKIITRSMSFPNAIKDADEALSITEMLLNNLAFEGQKVRLLGVSFSNFAELKATKQHQVAQSKLF